MKKLILVPVLSLCILLVKAQPVDYNNLPVAYKDIAVKAFGKISPSNGKWFATVADQHPAGSFDTAWATKQINRKWGKDGTAMNDLFVLMMAYQRMVNRDAREDDKTGRMQQQPALGNKAGRLDSQNAKIDQQKKEAAEKYDQSMQAANVQVATGIASGITQIAGTGVAAKTPNRADSVAGNGGRPTPQQAGYNSAVKKIQVQLDSLGRSTRFR